MDNQAVVTLVLIILAISISGYMWYIGKKETVLYALSLLVHKAEVYFRSGENQAKIDFVLNKMENIVPKYLKWLWNNEWIKKEILIILLRVEKELGYKPIIEDIVGKVTQDLTKSAKDYAADSAGTVTNYFADRLLSSSFNGDTNIVDNNTIKEINEEIQSKINKGIDLRAFANAKTDFKGKNEAAAGIEIKKTF